MRGHARLPARVVRRAFAARARADLGACARDRRGRPRVAGGDPCSAWSLGACSTSRSAARCSRSCRSSGSSSRATRRSASALQRIARRSPIAMSALVVLDRSRRNVHDGIGVAPDGSLHIAKLLSSDEAPAQLIEQILDRGVRSRRARARRAGHHGRHQRAARAARRSDAVRHQRGLRRPARDRHAGAAGAVRARDPQARAAAERGARGARARRRGWVRGRAARPRRGARARSRRSASADTARWRSR
jgi:hypothetical protein